MERAAYRGSRGLLGARKRLMHIELWRIFIAAALVALSVLLYRRTFPPVSGARRALLLGMRLGGMALLGILLINPVFLSKKVETRKPLVIVLLDRSRSMEIRDSNGAARLDGALAAAATVRRALGGGRADIEVIPFAGTLASAPLSADSAVRADADGTDIWGALEEAQRRYRSRNLSAIVLLTDGRVTHGMVASGERVGIPVLAVGYGDTLTKADISVDEVIADRVAYRGTKMPVEAIIRATGFKGRTITVRLLEGEKIRDSASIPVRRDQEIISTSLSYTALAEGEHRFSVEALPAAGEERRENNVESFRVDVLKQKVRILYIDQFPDWNMTFVRDLVKRSNRLEVETVSWIANRGFVLSPGEKPWTFPASAEALAGYDLVIVSDDARLFNARENVNALEAFVLSGGSVLFIADENSPLGRSGSFELLAPVLPLRRVTGPRVEFAQGFVRVAEEAYDDAIASMLAEDDGLDAMPPLSGRIAGVAANSLARVPLVLEDRRGRTPFLVIARRGEGLAGAVLGFPVWQWRLAGEEGGRIYELFFGGLVQYLAEGAQAPPLAIDTDRTVYRSGDRIRLTAYIGSRRSPEGIRAEVRRGGENRDSSVRTLVFEPDPRRKGYYRAELEPMPPGEYTVAASEVTDSGSGVTGATSFSVIPVSVEFINPSRDAALLADVARASGGSYLEGSQLGAFVARLNLTEQHIERRDVHELRGDVLVLIGIVVCIGIEWILRKAWGLV
jgi:hypothetical protein